MNTSIAYLLLSMILSVTIASPVPLNRNPVVGNKVVSYVSNWAQYRQEPYKFQFDTDIDPFASTHLVLAFAFVENNLPVPFEWNDESEEWSKGNYEKLNDLKRINPELRVLLAFGGWTAASEEFSAMVSTKESRTIFIDALIPFLRTPTCKNGPDTCYGFDGIDLDWEYPTVRGGVPEDRENFVLLVQELREAFDYESIETGYEPLLLTAAVPAGKDYIDQGYDVPALSEAFDFINLMSYDLGGAWEPNTTHNAPLYGGERSVTFAANYWVLNGCPKEKLVIGMPLYGRSFTLSNPYEFGLNVSASGAGPAGRYTGEAGFLSNYEIQEKIDSGSCIRYWLEEQKVPYCVDGNEWIGYDDLESLSYKLQFVLDEGFAGAMVWELPLDDFTNNYPLFSFISETMRGNLSIEIPSPSQTPAPSISPSVSPSSLPINTVEVTPTSTPSNSMVNTMQSTPTSTPTFISEGECIEHYGQCGGNDFTGNTNCCPGLECVFSTEWWSSCLVSTGNGASVSPTPTPAVTPSPTPMYSVTQSEVSNTPSPSSTSIASRTPTPSASLEENGVCIEHYGQCGGNDFTGNTNCCPGLECVFSTEWWSSCLVPTGTGSSASSTPIPSVSSAPMPSSSSTPIQSVPTQTPSPAETSSEEGISSIISKELFETMFPQSGLGPCSGGSIFSYEKFLEAASYYPTFGTTGSMEQRKREIAAFLGQTSQETSGWWEGQEYEWGYCFNSEVGCNNEVCSYCSPSSEYPCVEGKGYYGRGAIQISYNYNYGLFSEEVLGDKNILLDNPDLVLEDGSLAFRTALWFWMTPQSPKPSSHDVLTGGWIPSSYDIEVGRQPGYGMVTNIINGGLECGFTTPQKVINRVGYFQRYCNILGVSPGENIYCDQMQSY